MSTEQQAKQTEHAKQTEQTEQTERPERPEQTEKTEKTEKTEQPEQVIDRRLRQVCHDTRELLMNADILGLINGGAPTNENDTEAAIIAGHMSKYGSSSPESTKHLIILVFNLMFWEGVLDNIDSEALQTLSTNIHKLYYPPQINWSDPANAQLLDLHQSSTSPYDRAQFQEHDIFALNARDVFPQIYNKASDLVTFHLDEYGSVSVDSTADLIRLVLHTLFVYTSDIICEDRVNRLAELIH